MEFPQQQITLPDGTFDPEKTPRRSTLNRPHPVDNLRW